MATVEELDKRMQELEKDNSRKMLLQYLVYPLVLFLVGVYFNRQIEDARVNAQKLQIAQTLLPQLFSANHAQALASEKLNAAVLPKSLADDLNRIAEDYYAGQIKQDLKSGNIESAASLYGAAQNISGPVSEGIIKQVQNDPQTQEKLTKYQQAAAAERAGFEALLDGDFNTAIQKFQDSENSVNGYHQVYEIHKLLTKNRKDLDDPRKRREILQIIVRDYYRGAPKDLLERLRSA